MPKDRHSKWLSHSLETSGIWIRLHLSAFLGSQDGFLQCKKSITTHIWIYCQREDTVTYVVEYESITSKRNSFLLFSILTIAMFIYPRSMLIIKVYKIFLVPVLLKLLIMTLLYISQEKQLVKFSKFTFWLFAICFYNLPYELFLVSSFQMII